MATATAASKRVASAAQDWVHWVRYDASMLRCVNAAALRLCAVAGQMAAALAAQDGELAAAVAHSGEWLRRIVDAKAFLEAADRKLARVAEPWRAAWSTLGAAVSVWQVADGVERGARGRKTVTFSSHADPAPSAPALDWEEERPAAPPSALGDAQERREVERLASEPHSGPAVAHLLHVSQCLHAAAVEAARCHEELRTRSCLPAEAAGVTARVRLLRERPEFAINMAFVGTWMSAAASPSQLAAAADAVAACAMPDPLPDTPLLRGVVATGPEPPPLSLDAPAPTWTDSHLLRVAAITAQRDSDDADTKVGACVAWGSATHQGMACGANQAPPGVRLDAARLARPLKYAYVEHAERVALTRAALQGADWSLATLACTHFPCAECARMALLFGVRRLVAGTAAGSHPRWAEAQAAAEVMLREAGVEVLVLDGVLHGAGAGEQSQ